MGQYIYFEYKLSINYNLNQLNILVYNLDMGLQYNLVSMYMIQHSLVLYIRRLCRMVKVRKDLGIRPLMELKYRFKTINSLTDNYVSHR